MLRPMETRLAVDCTVKVTSPDALEVQRAQKLPDEEQYANAGGGLGGGENTTVTVAAVGGAKLAALKLVVSAASSVAELFACAKMACSDGARAESVATVQVRVVLLSR